MGNDCCAQGRSKDKIVKLFKTQSTDWAEHNLIWKEKDPKIKSEIVFTTEFEK